ncbi:pseudouridine synthase [Russula vinacea]|nr:pseudouridine synthase [Russula vinacea]
MAPDAVPAPAPAPAPARPGLRKIAPYWYPYTTMAKGRWFNREILEIVSTEFRDRSIEYYRYALESGVTTINGKIAKPGTIVRNGDRLENIVHRHEPPVTSKPVKILHEDREREFIVIDKPGSIPVHATGRYFYLSLVEILQREFEYPKVYTVNRLDRLTSGLMIIGLSSTTAHTLSQEFVQGEIKKEYIARCSGEFPAEEVVVDQPLLTVDRQMGLNIVHPEGKPAKTVFRRLHMTETPHERRPLTGRSHQIRVHLQYLGHPIANDPVYSETKIWGPNLGKGGIDTTPSDERAPPAAPAHLVGTDTADSTCTNSKAPPTTAPSTASSSQPLPRETGKDIGMGSPVPLSAEAVGIITRLRNMKDEDEDWSRWRDVVFKAKGRLHPKGMPQQKLPPQSRRKRGGPAWTNTETETEPEIPAVAAAPLTEEEALALLDPSSESQRADHPLLRVAPAPDAPTESGRAKQAAAQIAVQEENDGALYCSECYLPLHPDPPPERLLGVFETEMPEWAAEGWEWERERAASSS